MTTNPDDARWTGKRQTPRRPYEETVRFACYDGQSIPPLSEFQIAEGKDLSRGGVAFYTPAALDETDSLVIMLGDPPAAIYMEAVIRHRGRGSFRRRMQYRIGCEFVRKLGSSL